jgi:hypothetical protein
MYRNGSITDPQGKITEYIEHRLLREKQILETMGGGADTIPAIVKVIYAEVPEKLHAMAGQSVHSHLKKLAKEGRVSEETIPTAPSRWTVFG